MSAASGVVCAVCGVSRDKHGTYPTCATHEFRACCSTTPSEPYRKDCWEAGSCQSISLPAWQDVLGEAEQVVRQKHIYNKYIKGTILENDVPVWIADFSQRTLQRERARQQCSLQEALGLLRSLLLARGEVEYSQVVRQTVTDAINLLRNEVRE